MNTTPKATAHIKIKEIFFWIQKLEHICSMTADCFKNNSIFGSAIMAACLNKL